MMFTLIYASIHVLHWAPFNVPPSAAFLYNLGIENRAYSLLLHFGYGILWSFVLVYTFEDDLSMGKALLLALILWFFMMIVYSPLIGWGLFGNGFAHHLPNQHPIYLRSAVSYMFVTLLVHLVYGLVLGFLNRRFQTTV